MSIFSACEQLGIDLNKKKTHVRSLWGRAGNFSCVK